MVLQRAVEEAERHGGGAAGTTAGCCFNAGFIWGRCSATAGISEQIGEQYGRRNRAGVLGASLQNT